MKSALERLCQAEEAVSSIRDGQTLAVGGFVGAAVPKRSPRLWSGDSIERACRGT
jgi:acyl-CoA hydrolase